MAAALGTMVALSVTVLAGSANAQPNNAPERADTQSPTVTARYGWYLYSLPNYQGNLLYLNFAVYSGCYNLPGDRHSGWNNTDQAQYIWTGYNCSGARKEVRPGWRFANSTVRSISHT
ncbi:hypothetical protein [Herbihabitans rhizosphaerae]|uniref:hypothetical protein n=1 Tax=Herbihabitans rhizosphaerae TaxID=1872711 RepID=UPI00102CC968|nr:hypothetical protein [Herbihabitans rhizosphaerae]